MHLSELVTRIRSTHETLRRKVATVAAAGLTARNWLIGAYIVEFEQAGEDRARYGDALIRELARRLRVKGLSATALKLSRQFYLGYRDLGPTVIDRFGGLLRSRSRSIGQTASDPSGAGLPGTWARPMLPEPAGVARSGSSRPHGSEKLLTPPDQASRPGFAVPAVGSGPSLTQQCRKAGSEVGDRAFAGSGVCCTAKRPCVGSWHRSESRPVQVVTHLAPRRRRGHRRTRLLICAL